MKLIFFFATFLACLTSQVAFAQQAIYLKVSDNTAPTITGPVTAKGYANQIELTSAQFGEALAITRTGAGGSTVGRPSFTPITITKTVDASSAKLMQVLVTGRALDAIEINFVRGGETSSVYYKIELTEIFVINHSISLVPNCPNGCSGLAESFALDYRTIKVTTYTQRPDGSIMVDTPSYTFDRTTGR